MELVIKFGQGTAISEQLQTPKNGGEFEVKSEARNESRVYTQERMEPSRTLTLPLTGIMSDATCTNEENIRGKKKKGWPLNDANLSRHGHNGGITHSYCVGLEEGDEFENMIKYTRRCQSPYLGTCSQTSASSSSPTSGIRGERGGRVKWIRTRGPWENGRSGREPPWEEHGRLLETEWRRVTGLGGWGRRG